jgi:hypothetical protein
LIEEEGEEEEGGGEGGETEIWASSSTLLSSSNLAAVFVIGFYCAAGLLQLPFALGAKWTPFAWFVDGIVYKRVLPVTDRWLQLLFGGKGGEEDEDEEGGMKRRKQE